MQGYSIISAILRFSSFLEDHGLNLIEFHGLAPLARQAIKTADTLN